MHVVVTGAAGFSGAHIVRALLGRGHTVTAVIRSTRPQDLAGAQGHLAVLSGDLAGEIALPSKADAVVHAAARSPAPGVTDEQMMRDNVRATERLVAYAKRADVRTFVFLSSLSVHGRIEASVVDENTPSLQPDVYGQTKRQCEELIASANRNFRSLAIRLPGVIGRNSVRNWLTGLLATAREGREITVYNPDAKYNNAVHVSDLAAFVPSLLEQTWAGADALPIGAAGETTVIEAARLIAEAFGGRSPIRISGAAKSPFTISSARARERYGYKPMDIHAMLCRFVEENGGRPPGDAE